MNTFSVIHRHVLKELIAPFLISLLFLTFVFLMTRIPEITNMVMNSNAGLISICLLVIYTIPKFLEFTIPMSVMIAVLLAFMKMNGDNEILALRSSGISLYRLLPPVLIFCTAGLFLTLLITFYAESWGRYAARIKTREIIHASPDIALQERQFYLDIEGIMIYVNEVDIKSKTLKDIFIEDRRSGNMISISSAPRGLLIAAENRLIYTLRLYNGSINQVDSKNGSVNHVRFDHYDILINLETAFRKPDRIGKEIKEQSIRELAAFITRQRDSLPENVLQEALMQYHEKIAVPFACISLGLLAFGTGIRPVSRKRSAGLGMGVLFFLAYYLLLAVGWAAGETGKISAAAAMWIPNLIMAAAGIIMLRHHAGK